MSDVLLRASKARFSNFTSTSYEAHVVSNPLFLVVDEFCLIQDILMHDLMPSFACQTLLSLHHDWLPYSCCILAILWLDSVKISLVNGFFLDRLTRAF